MRRSGPTMRSQGGPSESRSVNLRVAACAKAVALCVAVMLSGCTSDAERSCLRSGGRWLGPVALGEHACAYKARDAGRPCRDGRECEGDCIAREDVPAGTPGPGNCSQETSNLGRCVNLVTSGAATGLICLE